MADKSIEKIKEQCLEVILNVMPLSQLGFIFVMGVVLDRLEEKKATSPIGTLKTLGLEDLFSVKGGLFWSVGVLILGAAFFLALFNTYVIKHGLRYSFSRSKISEKLSAWTQAASAAVKDLSAEEKTSIQKSVAAELEKRIKKYHAKRMLAESMCSIVSCIVSGSLYLIVASYPDFGRLTWSALDLSVLCASLLAWIGLHRNSVRYAISKVIPLQVYLSAATGEIAFFIDID